VREHITLESHSIRHEQQSADGACVRAIAHEPATKASATKSGWLRDACVHCQLLQQAGQV
jgi:hypothetical protein